jgi:hypothetical protein
VCLFVSCNSYACYPALLAKNLYWEEILLVHPIPKSQVTSEESTINSYAWYFKPFQVNFHVLPFKKPSNTSHFVPLFFSSWGHSGWVCYLLYWIKYPSTRQLHLLVTNFARELVRPLQSQKEKKKKNIPSWYLKVGRHPMESVSHGLRKKKGGEECKAIKEHQSAN